MAVKPAPTDFCQPGPLQPAGTGFKDALGNDFFFNGISWFGFDGQNGMLGGLDKETGTSTVNPDLNYPDTAMVRDWELVAKRIKLLGFNAIRLPFAFAYIMPDPSVPTDTLGNPMPRVDTASVARNCSQSGIQDIGTYMLPAAGLYPSTYTLADWQANPEVQTLFKSLPLTGSGTVMANQTIPDAKYTSTGLPNVLERFLHIIEGLVGFGFYVVLDCQMQQDFLTQVLMTSGKPGDWDKWVGLWVTLIQAVQARPATSRGSAIIDYIIVDIMNEPEASNFWLNGKGPYIVDLRWTQYTNDEGHIIPGMGDIYSRAMSAIFPISQGTLFFIEGTDGIALNWGDGFFRKSSAKASSPEDFFDSLASKSYASNVVISPHVYPSSVNQYYWRSGPSGGSPSLDPNAVPSLLQTPGTSGGPSLLYRMLDDSFGYLMLPYMTASGKTIQFPLCIGEIGTAFVKTLPPPPAEVTQRTPPVPDWTMSPGHPWSTLYVNGGLKFFPEWDPHYMKALNDYIHNYRGIKNCFWWSWNADAGDTGGIVATDNWLWHQDYNQGKQHIVLPQQGKPWTDVNWDIIKWMTETVGMRPWFA